MASTRGHASLPAGFQEKTIHSPEGADIFVRWGGQGRSVVVLIHGYAENSDWWAPLAMPVLAVGGEKSFGSLQAVIMRNVATDVREAVVAGSGHWLMQERPAQTVALIRDFLESA